MSRTIALVSAALLFAGCGTYRITYRFPSKQALAAPHVIEKHHSHGFGLIGGGAYFFALHQMFPALIDYTGERKVADVCPDGVYEVTHQTKFWHNAAAALISWLVLLNVYHPSQVEWTCASAPPPEPAAAPQPPTASPAPATP